MTKQEFEMDSFIAKLEKQCLSVGDSSITKLQNGLSVGCDLYLDDQSITKLPNGLSIEGSFYVCGSKITSLPRDLRIAGDVDISNSNITSLSIGLRIDGSFCLENTDIESLPKDLMLGGDLDFSGTKIKPGIYGDFAIPKLRKIPYPVYAQLIDGVWKYRSRGFLGDYEDAIELECSRANAKIAALYRKTINDVKALIEGQPKTLKYYETMLWEYELPSRMAGDIFRYIEQGAIPKDFLCALFANDLRGACVHARYENPQHIINYVNFIYNEIPVGARGSYEIVQKWSEKIRTKQKENNQ